MTETAPLALVRVAGKHTNMVLPITGPSFSVGRELSNNLCIADDPEVSRTHCVIHAMGSSLLVEDRSRNGTFLDGERVAGIKALPVPSSMKIGQTQLAILPYVTSAALTTSAMRVPLSSRVGEGVLRTSEIKVQTDAYLVVDIVDSTQVVQVDGPHFAKLVLLLGRTLENTLRSEPQGLLKCTGDGYLACYSTAPAALAAATRLAPAVKGQTRIDATLSIALHWGTSHLSDQGDRIGNNVHAVFGLEKLRHAFPGLVTTHETSRTGALVLMTEGFWSQLDPQQQAQTVAIGTHAVKGLEEAVRVYRWVGTVA